jgi:two-component sensor histidine kinase
VIAGRRAEVRIVDSAGCLVSSFDASSPDVVTSAARFWRERFARAEPLETLTVECELTLPGLPESVRQFRALVRHLAATPYQAEAAALCVSELVTNALLHSRSGRPGGEIRVRIEPGWCPGELRISVIDAGPRYTAPESGQSNGYGLDIVDVIAAGWGVAPAADGQSLTWCEIPAVAS